MQAFLTHRLIWIALISCTGCSMYSRRFYSEPEFCAVNAADSNNLKKSFYKYDRFITRPLPQVFRDSLGGTTVSVRIYNEYEFFKFGPPFIPLIPGREGYGYSPDKMNQADSNQLKKVIVELEIIPGMEDSVMLDPFSFFMVSRKTSIKSTPVSVNGLSGPHPMIYCKERSSWKITFEPGMRAQDKPLFFPESLQINGKPFHPDGIPFRLGKKSFYGAIISVNG